jgi:hypothetical protein
MLGVLQKAFDRNRNIVGDLSAEQWLSVPENIMYHEGDSVGLFTYEYPGVYSGHWFFSDHRGREALNLAKKFLGKLFSETPAQAIRGLTDANLRQARWAARQIGMTSYGMITINDKEYELFCMTKKEFLNE